MLFRSSSATVLLQGADRTEVATYSQDLDGIDGLIHISELSWSHVNHPSEVLTIGQQVNRHQGAEL